jgi:hypothetical protein
MIGHLRTNGLMHPLLLALLAVLSLPVVAQAETMYIRNETPIPIVVQTGSVVRGVLRRDPPVTLKATEVTPGTMLPGNKLITIYDARNPNRILFQGIIPAAQQDHQYGIVTDGFRMKIEPRQPFPAR